MIKLDIVIRGDKISTSLDETNDTTLQEASMFVYELERIKLSFVDKEWNVNFKVEGDIEE